MIHQIGIFLFLLSSVVQVDFCCASQQPELQILDQDGQMRGNFCPGSTARLKCIFPEEMKAWLWYVNGSEQATIVNDLPKVYQDHIVQLSREARYTLVNISKEEPYRASYICAVLQIPDNILSNSVEVIFQDTPPDDIKATCISNDSASFTVTVSYTDGCRRDTVVEVNGAECTSVLKSPRMAVFQCDGLEPGSSYNITAMDSDGHVDSLTCSTAALSVSSSSDMASTGTKETANSAYLTALVACLPVIVGAAAVLMLATYCYRRKRKHKTFLPHNGASSTIGRDLADEQIESTACQNSTELTSDENPPEDRSQPRDEKPEELQGSSSSDSSRDLNSTSSLLAQQQGGNSGSQYAILDFSSPAGTIKPPSPHDNVSYATIEPQHNSV